VLGSLLQLLSPAGPRARLSVLIFHRVLADADPLFPEEVDADRFDTLCRWVRAQFNVLPLDQAVARLRSGSLPERALALTFDDGYADNFHVALPILLRHGLTATFFIATGFIDGGRMWNDTVIEAVRRTSLTCCNLVDVPVCGSQSAALDTVANKRAVIAAVIGATKYRPAAERDAIAGRLAARLGAALPGDMMMTSDEVKGLRRAGMQIGAHTVSHPILARLDVKAIRAEIIDSKRFLESLLGEPVTLFAYPNGKPGDDYDERSVRIVEESGFHAALSTAWGAARATTGLFELPRFTPWDRSELRFGLRLAANLRRAPRAVAAAASDVQTERSDA
jgi:peptidoglycan/xylan/chitin deacetylase (PgdA/CDA1 family)